MVVWAWLTDGAVGTCWLGVGQESSQQEDGGKQLSSAHHTSDLTGEEQRCWNCWRTRIAPNCVDLHWGIDAIGSSRTQTEQMNCGFSLSIQISHFLCFLSKLKSALLWCQSPAAASLSTPALHLPGISFQFELKPSDFERAAVRGLHFKLGQSAAVWHLHSTVQRACMTGDHELHLESRRNCRRKNDPTVQQPAQIISQLVTISDDATERRHSKTLLCLATTLDVGALPPPLLLQKKGGKKCQQLAATRQKSSCINSPSSILRWTYEVEIKEAARLISSDPPFDSKRQKECVPSSGSNDISIYPKSKDTS